MQRIFKLRACLFIAVMAFAVVSSQAFAAEGEGSDSRIKTMVFDKDEVYTVLTKNGFATAIELSRKEKVQAISIGDNVGWQITPAKNRIFVKPLLRNSNTNLSIITDKRTYQIELIVSSAKVRNASHSYVVRFFYPSERKKAEQFAPVAAPVVPEFSVPQPFAPVSPVTAPQFPQSAPFPSSAPPPPAFPAAPAQPNLGSLPSLGITSFNFNYTLTGPEASSPTKIYDDGKSTYFEFDGLSAAQPQIALVTAIGTEQPLSVRASGNKYIVDAVASKFVIRNGGFEQICVFNESASAAPVLSAAPTNITSRNY